MSHYLGQIFIGYCMPGERYPDIFLFLKYNNMLGHLIKTICGFS